MVISPACAVSAGYQISMSPYLRGAPHTAFTCAAVFGDILTRIPPASFVRSCFSQFVLLKQYTGFSWFELTPVKTHCPAENEAKTRLSV